MNYILVVERSQHNSAIDQHFEMQTVLC